jgi:hypothetical protein
MTPFILHISLKMDSLSQAVANVTLDPPSHADINCQSMLQAVTRSRQELLDRGVPVNCILYIMRNSADDHTGDYRYTLQGIQDDIESCRHLDVIPIPPNTTWDCFCVDGRDTSAIRNAIDDVDDFLEDIRDYIPERW